MIGLFFFSHHCITVLHDVWVAETPGAVGSINDWDFSFTTIMLTTLRKDAWHPQTLGFDLRDGLKGLSQFGKKIKICLVAQVVTRNAGPRSLNHCGCCREEWLLLGWILYQMACVSLSTLGLACFFFVESELRTIRSLQSVLGCEGTQHHHHFLVIV